MSCYGHGKIFHVRVSKFTEKKSSSYREYS